MNGLMLKVVTNTIIDMEIFLHMQTVCLVLLLSGSVYGNDFYACFNSTLLSLEAKESIVDLKELGKDAIYELGKATDDEDLLLHLDDIDIHKSEIFLLNCKGEKYTVIISKYRFATGLGINVYGWLLFQHSTGCFCIVDSLSDDMRFLRYDPTEDCFSLYDVDYSDVF